MSFATVPSNATLEPKPFEAHVSDEALQEFMQLVKLSKIGPKTYENLTADTKDFTSFGIRREWLESAKQHWETAYSWRKTEARINSYPNFTVPVKDDKSGHTFTMHFVALFSEKKDAVPLVLLHGWPGSFLEFIKVLDVFKSKYGPATLPFHIIVPSLPGYAYSTGPPLDANFATQDIARIIDLLMHGLGFEETGYIAQGGDIGSFISRILGVTSPACKAVHLDLCIGKQGSSLDGVTDEEKALLERAKTFASIATAYAAEHGSRTATIGLALSASPLALLSWIGEKFLQWTDPKTTPSLDEILDSVTLYWFTESFARGIYPYRDIFGLKPTIYHDDPSWFIKKPLGFSWHPFELAPIPITWVGETGNLVWSKRHAKGGHFAAMEIPGAFVQDMEDFVGKVWEDAQKA